MVRAIADCAIPLISAWGTRPTPAFPISPPICGAPTPTAAAELAVPVIADVANHVAGLSLRAERCARRYHERARERLDALVRVLPRRDALLGPQRQRTDDLAARLGRALERRIAGARGELDRAAGALRPAMLAGRLDAARHRLDGASRLLDAAHPETPARARLCLGRGAHDGRGRRHADAARGAQALTLHFRDGQVDARVERGAGKTYAGKKPEQPNLL